MPKHIASTSPEWVSLSASVVTGSTGISASFYPMSSSFYALSASYYPLSTSFGPVSSSVASDSIVVGALSAAYFNTPGSFQVTEQTGWNYVSNNLHYYAHGKFLVLNGTISNYSGGDIHTYDGTAVMFTIPTASCPSLFQSYTQFAVAYQTASGYDFGLIQLTTVGTNYVFQFIYPPIVGPSGKFNFNVVLGAP